MIYFGTRLSGNISRREPEGYLICLNVPVARTGMQEYLPSELGMAEPDSRLIPVFRPEEEVFSPACIASFEGMPVTDDHPSSPEGVTAENSRQLTRGHCQHVRRGAGEESDLLLADLMITDPMLIEEILGGKREISCGYTYTLREEEGRLVQRDIRGNHVAVVDAGRAGPRVCIRDSIQKNRDERSNQMKKKSLWRAKLLARMAKDGDVEGLAELITEMMEEPAPAAAAVPAEAGLPAGDPLVSAVASAVAENLDPVADEETPAEPAAPLAAEAPAEQPAQAEAHEYEGDCGPRILEALHQIIALLSGPAADCGAAPRSADEDPSAVTEALAETAAEELAGNVAAAAVEALAETAAPELASGDEEDPVEELVAEILETGEAADPADPASDEEEEILSGVLEPVEADEGAEEEPEALSRDRAALGAAALREALVSFRPHLQRMSPKQRQRFNADVAARMRKLSRAAGGKPGAYAALRKTGARDRDGKALGRKIMEARNANLRR